MSDDRYRIIFTPRARNELADLSRQLQKRIQVKIDALALIRGRPAQLNWWVGPVGIVFALEIIESYTRLMGRIGSSSLVSSATAATSTAASKFFLQFGHEAPSFVHG